MSTEIREIELNIKEAQKMVDLNKALERLRSNRDFKKVIQECYLKDEAVRLVHLKADSNMQDEKSQAAIGRDIDAIGSLAQFLNFIPLQADMAQRAIDDGEAALDEMREEGVDE